jgi:hypothetical protein
MPGLARPEPLRAVASALVIGLFFLVSAPAPPASAGETRAAATQDGWWNRLQGPADSEPDGNPVRPLVPALPKPPNVPADAIAVGATGGQVDKVAAVGVDVSMADGDTLDGLVLHLKEAEGNGANLGADRAKVLACPATTPWGAAQNANWRDRPVADCSLGSSEGARAGDGTWTFDLAALGRQWADPGGALANNGVVLSVDPASSPNAQISWLDVDSGQVTVELTATPAAAGAGSDAGPPVPDAGLPAAPGPPAADAPPTPSIASGADGAGRSGATGPVDYTFGSGPSAAAGGEITASEAPPEPPGQVALDTAPGSSGPALHARPAVDFWEHVPPPTALLVPVVLALAVLIGIALGPAGRPSPVFRREGGLSRALARRNPGGVDAA